MYWREYCLKVFTYKTTKLSKAKKNKKIHSCIIIYPLKRKKKENSWLSLRFNLLKLVLIDLTNIINAQVCEDVCLLFSYTNTTELIWMQFCIHERDELKYFVFRKNIVPAGIARNICNPVGCEQQIWGR